MYTIKDIKKTPFNIMVKKWRYLASKDFNNLHDAEIETIAKFPSIAKLSVYCYYCNLFCNNTVKKIPNQYCKNCPLATTTTDCYCENHPYQKWSINPTATNAQAVLDLILETSPFK